MTEREWQRIENTMNFIVEHEAEFDARQAKLEQNFAEASRRMDRMERYADRMIRTADRRFERAEGRLEKADAERAELRAALKSFLLSMRRSQGNGKNRAG